LSWASYIVFVVVAGGMGTIAGPIIGAVIYIIVDRVLAAAAGQGLLVLGVLSILLMLLLPRGVMGIVHDVRFPQQGRRRSSGLDHWRRRLLGDDPARDRAALIDQPGVVAAYLLPASCLLLLRRDEPRYAELVAAMGTVSRELDELKPDTLVIYSTRWYAVLDQLWQGRARMAGLHVDDNWHELGEIRYDITTDVSLAKACVRAAQRAGIASKLVDYAGFPIDSATLAAQALVNGDGLMPTLIVANNLYHGFEETRALGEIVAAQSALQGKRVAVLILGGLSGGEHRDHRPFSADALASATEDEWNRRILKLIAARDVEDVLRQMPEFVSQARADMGFKHFAFALGALGGRIGNAEVYAYGPQYGSGAAVVRLF
jgi:2-aminophenol/2-amino-5-chlorophenol 1,6-dioxygenase alpha subunit